VTGEKTAGELRRFGMVMAAGLGLIGAILLWRHRPAWPAFLGAAAFFLLAGLALPRVLAPIERAWMTLAGWISVGMTYVILTLAFYLVITPFGLLLRALGKDFLHRGFEKDTPSYWVPVAPDSPGSRPDKPY
jgi:hypothetical protein